MLVFNSRCEETSARGVRWVCLGTDRAVVYATPATPAQVFFEALLLALAILCSNIPRIFYRSIRGEPIYIFTKK